MTTDYGKAFRIIRAAFGLQQSELAARMPVSASQLSLIEAGKRQPSVRVVNALAQALGIPTALISLLASPSSEVHSKPNEEISDLSRALLRVLVAAQPAPQRSLDFQKGSR